LVDYRVSMKASWKFLLVLGLAASLAACAGARRDNNRYVQGSINYLYNLGYQYLQSTRYKQAVAFFDEVERQYPYSVWARRAQLMSAYASYLDSDYATAILTAQRFTSLHPGSSDAAYAFYLIAICYYEQITDVGRDQQATQQALDALNDVVRRFPNSSYAEDAKLKIDLTRDHLAGKEMEVGRFYQMQRNFVAALGRFRTVLDSYGTTTHVPEALERMTEVYLALGLTGEAQRSAAVLGFNFPHSRWYRDSYDLLRAHNLLPKGDKAEVTDDAKPRDPAS
jgi:outer membrane protein assembly factor BamD